MTTWRGPEVETGSALTTVDNDDVSTAVRLRTRVWVYMTKVLKHMEAAAHAYYVSWLMTEPWKLCKLLCNLEIKAHTTIEKVWFFRFDLQNEAALHDLAWDN